MENYAIVVVVVGIGLGLLYILKAVYQAENDPETFDQFKADAKYRKPENWKKGELPENIKKKRAEDFSDIYKE
ncbi:MAG: hypothetical protein WD431_14760 [Cyclobacteriaceae bacterium]